LWKVAAVEYEKDFREERKRSEEFVNKRGKEDNIN